MKPYLYSLIAAAAACGLAQAQSTAYTTPVGYETLPLASGQFNIIGVRLHASPVAAGTFDDSTSSTLVDNQASFSLDPSTQYVIELNNGASVFVAGSNVSATTVSSLSGITVSYRTSYVIRKANTVASIFGSSNEAGLTPSPNADPTEADIVYIPSGASYIRAFYSSFTEDPAFLGWLDADTFEKIPNQVIDSSQGLYVQLLNSSSSKNLVVTGEVKKMPTAFVASNGFSLMGSVYPAGATLATSTLSSYVQTSPNADPTEADVVLLPKTAGGFTRAFFSTFNDDPSFAGWLDADSFEQIPSESLTSGFLIQKVGPDINGLMTPPSSYSNL